MLPFLQSVSGEIDGEKVFFQLVSHRYIGNDVSSEFIMRHRAKVSAFLAECPIFYFWGKELGYEVDKWIARPFDFKQKLDRQIVYAKTVQMVGLRDNVAPFAEAVA